VVHQYFFLYHYLIKNGKIQSVKNIILTIATFLLMFQVTSCSKKPELSVDDILRRAVKHGDQGDWKLALEDAELAVEMSAEDANINAIVMKAIALEYNRKATTGLNEIDKVAASDPTNFMAQFTLGRMLFNKGEKGGGSPYFTRALEPLTKAADLRPENTKTQILLAMCMARLGIYDESFRIFNKLRRDERFKAKPEVYNEAAVVKALSFAEDRSQANLDIAKSYFLEAYKHGKKNPKVVMNLAVFCDYYLGNKPAAVRFYDRYILLTKDSYQLASQRKEAQTRRNKISQ